MCDLDFLLVLKIPPYLTFFVPNIFFEAYLSLMIYWLEGLYKNWRRFNFEKQRFLDGVRLPEALT